MYRYTLAVCAALGAASVLVAPCAASQAIGSRDDVPKTGHGPATFTWRIIPGFAEATGQARDLYDRGELPGAEAAARRAFDLWLADAKEHHREGEIHYAPGEVCVMLGDILLDEGKNTEALRSYALCGGGASWGSMYATVAALCRLRDRLGALAALREAAHTYGMEERIFARDADPDAPGVTTLPQIEATALLERSKELPTRRAVHDLLLANRLLPRCAKVAERLGALYETDNQSAKAVVWYRRAGALGHGELATKAKLQASWLEQLQGKAASAAAAQEASNQAETLSKP